MTLLGWALVGSMGPNGPVPNGVPWGSNGFPGPSWASALVGPALMGTLGPDGLGPDGSLQGLNGWALMGSPGLSWAGP